MSERPFVNGPPRREPRPSVERLREVLRYEPETGDLIWLVQLSSRRLVGEKAGCSRPDGYVSIRLDNVQMLAHRIAWALMTGAWPTRHIDHRDGEPGNNRWPNLRNVSRAVNMQNIRHATANSKCGLLGVTTYEATREKRYVSRIRLPGGGVKSLGYFHTPEEAHAAYVAAKRSLHEGNTL